MALSIRSRSVEDKARRSAAMRGTTITEAIEAALDKQIADEEDRRQERAAKFLRLVREIQEELAALPILDPRPIDEILYDEDGLPH